MSISIVRISFQYAFFFIMILLFSSSAAAMIITGTAGVLKYQKNKGQAKQCIELPVLLDSKQQHYRCLHDFYSVASI
jgi:hypothetical protein